MKSKNYFKMFLALTLMLATTLLWAGEVTLHVSKSNGDPLPDVQIRYNNYGANYAILGTTDANGDVVATVPDGTWTFRASYNSSVQYVSGTSPGTVYFQTALATGFVKDCDNNNPLSGVQIRYNNFGANTIPMGDTDVDGMVSFELFPGTYNISAVTNSTTSTKSLVLPAAGATVEFNPTRVCFSYNGQVRYNNFGSNTVPFYCDTYLFPGTYNFKFGGNSAPLTPVTISGCTMNSSVLIAKLTNSSGDPVEGGIVRLGVGGWPQIGTTNANGLLVYVHSTVLSNMKIQMQAPFYGGSEISALQYVPTNPLFEFQTSRAEIHLLDHAGNGLNGGDVRAGVGGWPLIGQTGDNGNGKLFHEYFAGTFKYRLTYNHGTQEIEQDISNPFVYKTGLVKLHFSGSIHHGVGGWPSYLGATEMLPIPHKFRLSGGGQPSQEFWITPISGELFERNIAYLRLISSTNVGIQGAAAAYRYAWEAKTDLIATNTQGVSLYISENLASNVRFTCGIGGTSIEKTQNITANSFVIFQTVKTTVSLLNSANAPITSDVDFKYRYAWEAMMNIPADGELLPVTTRFTVNYRGTSIEKSQNLASNSTVEFNTVNTTFSLLNSLNNPITTDVDFKYRYGWEDLMDFPADGQLLPVTTRFTVDYRGTSIEKLQNLNINPAVVFNTGKVSFTLTGGVINDATFKYRYEWETKMDMPGDGELLPVSTRFTCYYSSTEKEKSATVVASTTTEVNFIWDGTLLKSGVMGEIAEDVAAVFNYKLYPVPTNTRLNVEINFEADADVVYQVIDMTGRTMKNGIWKLNKGLNTNEIAVDDLVDGQYIFRLKSSEKVITEKFSVSKY